MLQNLADGEPSLGIQVRHSQNHVHEFRTEIFALLLETQLRLILHRPIRGLGSVLQSSRPITVVDILERFIWHWSEVREMPRQYFLFRCDATVH